MLLEKVGPSITKKTTFMREPVSPEVKLAITLRFLATGESYESLMYQYRVHKSTISKFIPKVCYEIYRILKDEYMRMPESREEWEKYATETERRWQFPNCIAAADGKHIAIINPAEGGSEFFNYKNFFSIVLLAIVDYDYKFVFVDVGCQGRISDGGVYRNSYFYRAIEENKLNLPDPKPLPLSHDPVYIDQCYEAIPYVVLGDDAFPLGIHCMKPYAQQGLSPRKRIFNYRLSRARRLTENAFGIWVNRFRVFTTKMCLHPDKAALITLASLVLHNMLRDQSRESYTPDGFVDEEFDGELKDGTWRSEALGDTILHGLSASRSNNRASKSAEYVREVLADHFWGPGQVPWQWKMI